MIVKPKFDLLKGTDNVLRMSPAELKKHSVDRGPRKVFVVIDLMKDRVSHYTKNKVLDKISNIKDREAHLTIVHMPNYPLPITYNISTKTTVINIAPFGIDDVEPTKPGAFNLYALMVYGIVFSDLVSGKMKLGDKYASVIGDFFSSVLIRLFGKQYGLLGSFSTQIPKMKFLTNVYILDSFFGVKGLNAYKKAGASSSYNYKEIVNQLNRYNFNDISDFIKSLSDFGVMPNLNKHIFAQKALRFFGLNVIPAFEDCSRFISTIAASDIKGSSVVPTYISKYNERDFAKLLTISKTIFKRN